MNRFSNIPDVLTIADVQRLLKVGRSTACHLVKQGDIESIRIGRLIRIPKRYVIEYIEKNADTFEHRERLYYDDNVTVDDMSRFGE